MVFKIIMCLFMVCVAAFAAYTINIIRVRNKTKMSFMEAFNLTELVIVTFTNNGNKLNFLLDTGSDSSYISRSAYNKGITGEKINSKNINIIGCTGASNSGETILAPLAYKNTVYDIEINVLDSLDDSFAAVKSDCGVQLHGILGNDFLHKHNFVVDFEELTVYNK